MYIFFRLNCDKIASYAVSMYLFFINSLSNKIPNSTLWNDLNINNKGKEIDLNT